MGKVTEQEGAQGLAPGTLIDGRYKVVRFIGSGGNGAVHEVEHVLTGRRLALKSLLDETSYGRLEQEARATSLMKNGHAVKVTDMGTNASTGPYIVMELLEGQSLRALLDETGQLPLELTVNIALQVCECLAEAHAHGIIHRDLKPDNVFLCPGGAASAYDVKVLDFGVVKIASDGPIPNSSLTRTGSTVGTPFYMSLEQLRNSSAVDSRADIYALGVLLYECLAGRKPFQAETIGDLVYALCSGPPTQLSRLRPDLPNDVCDVVMKALAMNREQRQASMSELAADLAPFGDGMLSAWLKAEARRERPGSSGPPRGGAGAPTPSSVKRGLAPPASFDRRKESVPVENERRSGIDRRRQQREIEEDRRRPPFAPGGLASLRDGDRDTPTEMYVKAAHGPAASYRGSEPPPDRGDAREQRDTPTRALDAPIRGDVALDTPFRAPPPIGPADPEPNRTPLAFLETQRSPFDPSLVPGAPPSRPGSSPPDSAPLGAPAIGASLAAPGGPLPGVAPMSSSGIYAPTGAFPAPQRPGWQQKLDRALTGVGGFLEGTVTGGVRRFRAASPRMQLVLVITGASLLAALLVLTLFLAIR